MMASSREIVELSAVQVTEDKLYVALGEELKENKLTLKWALHNPGGRKICILHVHQPAQWIPTTFGTKFHVSQLGKQQVMAYRVTERQEMDNRLREYCMICEQARVHADIQKIDMDNIEKGLVELISQHGIRKLVMGAAADKRFSKKMTEPKSKKAIYVRLHAPPSCHIWFICKGNLVHTREGVSMEIETGQASSSRSRSVAEVPHDQLRPTSSGPDHCRVRSDIHGMRVSALAPDGSGGITPCGSINTEGSFTDLDEASSSLSLHSRVSSCSSSDLAYDSSLTPPMRANAGSESRALVLFKEEDHRHSSPPSVSEGGIYDKLYDQLEQGITEAETSRRDESTRCRKAEKDAIDAILRAKTFENLYREELRQRKEIEQTVSRGKEELDKMKQQVDGVIAELRISLEQKSLLESQIANSNQMVQELEQKMFSALKEAEELRIKQAEEASNTLVPQVCCEFSFSEIVEATRNFDSTLKIGEGGYGSIYSGLLRHTRVAIKMLHSNSLQGPSEFQQEVNVLSKLRHPNLVTLIGACPEAWILVYEYLPNGSLEDRLNCRGNSQPLSWQTRTRIAAELCSVLIFLHSCSTPHSIVHGDLKPANVLLDANNVSKLSDFAIRRVISQNYLSHNTTLCCTSDTKGTFAHMDPEFLATGELTTMADVYSFGVILLQLLTGRPALGITKLVQYALDNRSLKHLLDPTAGDWPFVQAEQLALMAMRCCEMNHRNRPDLASELWRMLEPMRVSCGSPSSRMSSEDHGQIPSYFICPIFQEIMRDPHVAADGFTYELEALKGWLDSGHDTSPMTNLQLPHCNLVPNHALRSAILEWLEQH